MHHPEQHRVDVDRHGVGGQRLLGGEAGGDGALIDPGRHAIHERHDPEQSRPAQPDEPPEPQHDAALPLLGDSRRRHQHEADERHDDERDRVAGGVPAHQAEPERADQNGDGHDVDSRSGAHSSDRRLNTETMETPLRVTAPCRDHVLTTFDVQRRRAVILWLIAVPLRSGALSTPQ